MLSQELLTKVIGFAAQAGDMDAVAELTGILNDTYINPAPEKKKRAANNTSGYVQIDIETGKEIARYATVKEANIALGKKETASNISDACRAYRDGKSNKAWNFAWQYGSDFDAQKK